MKFNIYMFSELLEEYEPQMVINSEIQQDLENIRLFFQGTPRLDNTLYVETGDTILGNGDKHVYCIQRNNYFITNSTNVNVVFNSIITILEETQKWINNLNTNISNNCLLSDVIDEFRNKIPFPLMVLDASQTALAISSKYGLGSVDERWDKMIETGSLGVEAITEYNDLYKSQIKERDFYEIPAYPFPFPSYNRNIYVNGEFMGFLSMILNSGGPTQGQKGWLYVAWEEITNWVSIHMIQNDMLLKNKVFEELLSGSTENSSYLLGSLGVSGWSANCSKIIIVLSCVSNHLNMNAHISKLFNQHNQYLFSIEYSNNIIILANMDHITYAELRQLIQPTIQHSGYYGGYSNQFTSIDEVSHYYMQAMLTLRSSSINVGELISCQEHLLPYIFHLLDKNTHMSLSHPALSKLKEYDNEHKTNYYEILYAYLQNQSNQTESANALNMHRSSLIRKLAAITELTGLDLDSYNTRLHLLISFELENRK